MRPTFHLSLLTVALLFAAPVRADDWKWCASEVPTTVDRRIAACTAIVERRGPPSGLAVAYNNRANGYMQKGDLDRAIADYNEAIRLKPHDPIAYLNRGHAYSDKGDFDAAMRDYDEALRLDREFVEALSSRGMIHMEKGDYARALADLDHAIRLWRREASFFSNRCLVRAIANVELERALADCDQAIRMRPYARPYENRALVYLRMGRYGEAVADCDIALKIGSQRSSALFVRGIAKRRLGDAAGGNADMVEASRLNPDIRARFLRYGIAA